MGVARGALAEYEPSVVTTVTGPRSVAWQRNYARLLVVSDVIVVVLAMACAQMVKLGRPVTELDPVMLYFGILSLIVAAIWLSMLAVYRTRARQIIGAGMEEYQRVLSATLSTVGVVAVFLMIFRPEYARGYLAVAFPLGLVLLVLGRSLCRRFLAWRRRHGQCVISVLAVGNPGAVRNLVQSLKRSSGYGFNVVGVCLTGHIRGGTIDVPGLGELPVLGDENDVEQALLTSGADTVALTATEHLGAEGIRELSWQLDRLGVDLVVSPGMSDVAGPRLTMRPVAGLPLIHVERPQYSGTKKLQKRFFDVVVSLGVLTAAAPLMILSAIAIKLTSRGPIFYRSERIGVDGKPFNMIKFRTMVVDADKQVDSLAELNEFAGGVLFKIREDPRVTRVGRILRRYSIDELPQFFNVLNKEMSVVGPRPPLRREVDAYTDRVRRRLLVLPGITGLWQVSGRADLSWDDAVRLDLSYVENWSISNDVLIAFKTVRTVLGGVGAY